MKGPTINKLKELINNTGIKAKLIFIFIFIKVLPLALVSYIAVVGTYKVGNLFVEDSNKVVKKTQGILKGLVDQASDESIKALDAKSQQNLEGLTEQVASSVANFLNERDQDLLLLANLDINQRTMENFFNSKKRKIHYHEKFVYDDKKNGWVTTKKYDVADKIKIENVLPDNRKEFHQTLRVQYPTKEIPIYKEISFYDLNGVEKYKISNIDKKVKNISVKENTYIKAETYFKEASNLKKNEIWVSEVIGAAVRTHFIGPYTKKLATEKKVTFNPEDSAYAGLENPVGKKFEGIIRFVTPYYRGNEKIGYLTLALDHAHIMDFTDYLVPKAGEYYGEISDAAAGNYAFIWDYQGRSIAHPRKYSIVGFDPKTGERVPGWISKDIAEKWEKSGEKDLNKFLETFPKFDNQSFSKQKPNVNQVKAGYVSLDCRYLNFAPQCQGWHQITQDGGSGSFIILWSGIWKLTTAAAIPYFTGRYGQSKRGFGFVTIGASVDEFHQAATTTKEKIKKVVDEESTKVATTIENSKNMILKNIKVMVNNLIGSTIFLIILVVLVAIWMSNYLTSRIRQLLKGAEEFTKDNLDYRIEVLGKDEMGVLASSFNDMAHTLDKNKHALEDANQNLEKKVEERTAQLKQKTDDIQNMLQNMRQGIFTILEHNLVHHEYSVYLEFLLKTKDIADKDAITLLFNKSSFGRDEIDQITGALLNIIGEEDYAFDLNAHLLPTEFTVNSENGEKKILEAVWEPIVEVNDNNENIVKKIMVILRDVTEVRILKKKTEEKEREMEIVQQILSIPIDRYKDVIRKSEEELAILFELFNKYNHSNREEFVNHSFRILHTLKGNYRLYGLTFVSALIHDEEKEYHDLRSDINKNVDLDLLKKGAEKIKASIAEYQKVYNHILKSLEGNRVDSNNFVNTSTATNAPNGARVYNINDLAEEGKKGLEKIAKDLGKPTPEVILKGKSIQLNEKQSSILRDVLMHCFRNSLDHGIESPDQRKSKGLNERGQINLTVLDNNGVVELHLYDDGQGLNLNKLREIGIKNKIFKASDNLDDNQIANIIFSSGISTASKVTDISGRGVGLDAVRDFLKRSEGSIDVVFTSDKKREGLRNFKFVIKLK
ncbi:MAG: HAMP domain-containing protein [Oligoflexia bacterium]|nr:HAMP domain-containing protein [Oligoflexia bacterium]